MHFYAEREADEWLGILADEMEDDVAISVMHDGDCIHIEQGSDCVVIPIELLERAFVEIVGAVVVGRAAS